MRWRLKAALALTAIFVAAGAYQAGKWQERSEIRAKAAEARVDHIEGRKERENDIEELDPSGFRAVLDGMFGTDDD